MADSTVTLATPCREYRGARNEHGYGIRNRSHRRLHRWVVAAILGDEAIEGKVVMHLCDNPPCFRFDHLRVGTRSENNADAYAKGRKVAAGRRLSDSEVGDIRASTMPVVETARQYGVSHSLISMIRKGARRNG